MGSSLISPGHSKYALTEENLARAEHNLLLLSGVSMSKVWSFDLKVNQIEHEKVYMRTIIISTKVEKFQAQM